MKSLKDLISRTEAASKELRAGLAQAREQLEALKAQRAEIEDISPTMEVVRRRVEEFADRVAHSVHAEYPSPERFLAGSHYHRPEYFEPPQVLAFYLKDILAEAILERCAETAAERLTISESERKSKLAKLDEEILAAELAEEAVIRMAEASGFPVERRIDADPRAILSPDEDLPR